MITASDGKDESLPPVTPNRQTEIWYRRQLDKAVANMQASYAYWLEAKYKPALAANIDAERLPNPELAQDAAPTRKANKLFSELPKLRKYWSDHFEELAKKLAQQVSEKWGSDNAVSWEGKLKRAGFTVEMQLTPSQQLLLDARTEENVALIKSIQEQYHKDVTGIVMRSFTKGRDLSAMTDELKSIEGVTTRRAAFIARDQSNKATAQMNAARQRELGLNWAVWVHSSAGKEPRHTHVTAGREQYIFDTQTGIDFNDGFGSVLPGEAINCGCTARSIIPALGRGDIESRDDLVAVSNYAGAYKAKKGKSAGAKMKQDVTKTRVSGQPVRYS